MFFGKTCQLMQIHLIQKPLEVSLSGNAMPFTFAIFPYAEAEKILDIRLVVRVLVGEVYTSGALSEIGNQTFYPDAAGIISLDIRTVLDPLATSVIAADQRKLYKITEKVFADKIQFLLLTYDVKPAVLFLENGSYVDDGSGHSIVLDDYALPLQIIFTVFDNAGNRIEWKSIQDNNVTTYINYFRRLAVTHRSLQHDPASETESTLFGVQRFTKISAEQVLKGLRSKIGFPCLTLELYETDTDSAIVYDVKQKSRGAFMVLDHPASDSHADQEKCYRNAERIIYQLLKKIWQDHYGQSVDGCNAPFREFDFDKISITPVGPVFNNEHGWRVEFDFEFQNNIDIAQAPEAGIFT